MGPVGLINGKIIGLDEQVIELEDRGYQFGDGVYEVTRVYNGRCFAFTLHMDRLYRSLRELKIPATYTVDELAEFHEQLIKESGLEEAAIYLQITRGVAPRAHGFPDSVVPRLTMTIRPVSGNQALRDTGATGIFVPDVRWMRCDIKSINLLGNLLAKQAAKDAGVYEGIQVRDGIVTEGSSSNFFVVKDGILWTHPLSNLILQGITRTVIVEKLVPELGLTLVEKAFDVDFVKKSDEAFVTGTTTEIMPFIRLDGAPVGDGKVGPVARKLYDTLKVAVANACGTK
ncbi:MAG: D-amino-acid transaminase [Negativicutes bacterium]|nr:D-amino-acid transaminase [Negativicutes bacterium]